MKRYHKMDTLAYGVTGPTEPFTLMHIQRRTVGAKDVEMDIIYAGICHSDIHSSRNEWGGAKYPMVPGHEILGRVVNVGSGVAKFKTGDLAGVGCMVDSCKECHQCKRHEEQYCTAGMAPTYNGFEMDKKTITQGGYSTKIVVNEEFAIKVSDKFTDLRGVAPLFCAGITTYSPLNAHKDKVGPGKKVGVIGLGGLGHMGVKFAVAMGADVTVFSTTPDKEEGAKKLGAKSFIVSKNAEAMKAVAGTFDFLLDTVSAKHDLVPYIQALAPHGVVTIVGAPPEPFSFPSFSVIFGNRSIYGEFMGLDDVFC
eukprot:TRINITY_DN839_c0_g1_i1.p1 TRINITY_DN839_c0_g1~~TRINITY_DN839_c0_g1_i1.p1  ORF type:complete len:310 (+),score=28.80 TRINITY_DN839_c0_g1_i1:17-946(+)